MIESIYVTTWHIISTDYVVAISASSAPGYRGPWNAVHPWRNHGIGRARQQTSVVQWEKSSTSRIPVCTRITWETCFKKNENFDSVGLGQGLSLHFFFFFYKHPGDHDDWSKDPDSGSRNLEKWHSATGTIKSAADPDCSLLSFCLVDVRLYTFFSHPSHSPACPQDLAHTQHQNT